MSSRRRIGRPRIRRGGPAGDPSDEILAAASRLFGEHGVTGTTMAQIASAAGLQQSSLYYYFRSKEEILARLVAEANVVPLQLAQRVRSEDGAPAVRLYRFVRGDVVALCLLPFDINEVHRYASRDRDRFATYWRERRTLQSTLAAIIREGIADGSLRPVNARLAALSLISNDEAVQNWFRHDSRPLRDPVAIGAAIADLSVGGLMAAPVMIGAVVAQAGPFESRDPFEGASKVARRSRA